MYPEVETFVAALEVARAERDAAFDAIRPEMCDGALRPGECPRCVAMKPIRAALQAAQNAAWAALCDSQEPLVAWIATNCRGYEWEGEIVLQALPASREALDRMAEEHGWCRAWKRLCMQAQVDGVLPARTVAASAE